MGDKKLYENEINQSPIFDLDRTKEPAAYEREKNRLIENIYLYKLEDNPENEDFGLEIVETIGDCLQYYEKEKGPFIHYFNRSYAQRKNKAKAKESLQTKSSGMHFSQKEIDNSRAVHAFLSTHDDVSPTELVSMLSQYADAFEMTKEEILDAVQTYSASLTQSGDMELSEEEGYTLFDTLTANSDFTEEIGSREQIRWLIDLCEQCYEDSRGGTKEYLSMKLTSDFADWDQNGDFTEYIRSKSFFHEPTFDAVYYSGKKLKNKEISQMLNKSEANLTQTWKRFQQKLQEMAHFTS